MRFATLRKFLIQSLMMVSAPSVLIVSCSSGSGAGGTNGPGGSGGMTAWDAGFQDAHTDGKPPNTGTGGGATCQSTSCEAKGASCGSIPDGCGGELECGSCGEGHTCGGAGTPNVCGI